MKGTKNVRFVFLLMIMALATAAPSFSQTPSPAPGIGKTLGKVNIESVARQDTVQAGAEAQFAVMMNIKDGWHLNAHHPTLDYLIGVNLSMDTGNKAIISGIQYPKPVQKQFSFAKDVLKVYEGKAIILVKMKTSDKLQPGTYKLAGKLRIQACSDEACLAPSTAKISLPLTIGNHTVSSGHHALFQKLDSRTTTTITGGGNSIASMFNQRGYFLAFLSIFLIGLALNLTPCVYPMMSVTISLFGGQEMDETASTVSAFSKALVYMLGIVFMYSVLGVAAAFTGGLFGSWMQSPWVLAGIGALILLLSLSMFGLYELQPPAWMMQKLGKTQQVSGYVGHFLSGLLVGVFAAPCIGPPIIALLAFVGAQGSPTFGFAAFFVMALGLGLPYLILGTFSGLLSKMPTSGVWMLWVEKLFGIILVGVGLFYLLLAFIPDYSMYAVLATVVIGGVYLGFIESSGNKKAIFRWVKYAIGAGALVAGFFLFQNLQEEGVQWRPYNAAVIKQTNKPAMLDFYADWCIPCVEMDRKTFTNDKVVGKTASLIRMKVDLTHFDSKQSEKLREKYNIAGVPTIVFLDSTGNEVKDARVVGYLNAHKFLKQIDKLKRTNRLATQ
jgi:thiol:disulfide interchange protein DsbD